MGALNRNCARLAGIGGMGAVETWDEQLRRLAGEQGPPGETWDEQLRRLAAEQGPRETWDEQLRRLAAEQQAAQAAQQAAAAATKAAAYTREAALMAGARKFEGGSFGAARAAAGIPLAVVAAPSPSTPVALERAPFEQAPAEEKGIPREVLIGGGVVGVLALAAVVYKVTRKKKR